MHYGMNRGEGMKKWGKVVFAVGLTIIAGIGTGCFSAPQAQPSSTASNHTVEKGSESAKGDTVKTTRITEKPQQTSSVPESDQPKASGSGGSAHGSNQLKQAKPPTSTGDSPVQKESAAQIESKYVSQLSQLEGYYQGQLEAMHNEAVSAKRKGESKTSIYNRYAGEARDLQEDSQAKVNQLLFQYKSQLKAQHLPVDRVNELRQSYYARIDSAKDQLLQKLK
jgi:hypothetical protein